MLLVRTPDPDAARIQHEFPVREVYYASKNGNAYHRYAWEVRLDTGEVFPVSGGAALDAEFYATPEPRPLVR